VLALLVWEVPTGWVLTSFKTVQTFVLYKKYCCTQERVLTENLLDKKFLIL